MTEPSAKVGSATGTPLGRRLHVCHVAYTFYDNDNRVLRYAEALAERGHQVEVIALRGPGQARSGFSRGVRVFRLQRREMNERGAWTYLVKLLWFFIQSAMFLTVSQFRRRYDVVHVHNVPDFMVFVALVPKLMGAKIILDIHDILPELYGEKFGAAPDSAAFRAMLWVERISCRFADHVIVANHLWHERLIRRAVPASKCTTIMNYPDLRLFKPLPDGKKRQDGKFIILYPGTLNHHQGLDIAIKAFALAKDRMPNAEFHIYGEGPTRTELLQLKEQYGLNGRVKIMDCLPIARIADVIASSDVGVVPKRAEGFGNEAFSTKILEFMACEVPVIVSRTLVDSYYFDETMVRFFPSGEQADLAEALVSAYDSRSEHSARIKVARDFALNHSWQERGADYQRLIEALIGPTPGPDVVGA